MCGHNLCYLQSALPLRAPRVLSISAGQGGAGRGKACFSRGGAGRASQQELLQIYLTSPILMSTIARGTINNNHVFKSLTPKVVAEDDHDDADQDDDNVDDNDVENNVIMSMTMTMMMRTM